MSLKEPESMEELVYFTNRNIGDKGHAKVWVFRKECPACKKGIMGKPVDPKTGKVKTRATEYVCQSCGNSMPKKDFEDMLDACVVYTCPECGNQSEKEVPFKRKSVKGVMTLRFECDKCGCKIDVTKKMKESKK